MHSPIPADSDNQVRSSFDSSSAEMHCILRSGRNMDGGFVKQSFTDLKQDPGLTAGCLAP
jgi:hypothetical protein